MDFRNAFRRNRAESPEGEDSASPGGSETAPSDASEPFDGYGRLNDRQVMASLKQHSQVELIAIEGYERAHQARLPVLDKLRYMRGSEPVAGYDAMDSDEAVALLAETDMPTIKRIRAYERKFAGRRVVLEKVVEVHARALAEQAPATAAPAAR